MCALKKLRYIIRDHMRAGILRMLDFNFLVVTACIQVEPNTNVTLQVELHSCR